MKPKLTLLFAAMCATPASAADWVTTIDAATYGSVGTITFNDWGYTGPTGVGANDFQVGSGFDASSIGQVQHVVTQAPDWKTPDPAATVVADMGSDVYANANMDGGVNFFKWGYTTPADSTFSNMEIDTAGNYHIAKQDMSFGYYDEFQYVDKTGVNASSVYDTQINFKPYAVSDAAGWCGSVLTPNPEGVAVMAGQVTFDFAMDIYFDFNLPGGDIYSSTQLAPAFTMRSYGDYTVDVTKGGETGYQQLFYGSAVGNNTNPESVTLGTGGELDPAYLNEVSFLGAGVLPKGVWVSADSFNSDGSRKMRVDHNPTTGETVSVWDVTIVEAGTPGAVWHANSFAGYAYLLRADGVRFLDYVNPDGHSVYVATVPEPEAYATILAGLALVGLMARRRGRFEGRQRVSCSV